MQKSIRSRGERGENTKLPYLQRGRMCKALLFLAFLLCCGTTALFATDWTVLVYMAADNDLSSFAVENIIQMESAVQAENLKLVVQVDLPELGAKRYLIQENQSPGIGSSVLQNLGTIDSGDPMQLQDFIRWGFGRYPSQHKMLIIWSHADSWYKSPKYIAPDQDSGNVIGVANGELASALSAGPKLDILLFDACSMQSIEIVHTLRHYADIIVGSADQVPVQGFPYSEIVPVLAGNPELLAAKLPKLYTDSYLPGSANNPSNYYYTTTCSAVKTDKADDFYQAFKDFSRALRPVAGDLAAIREELFEMNSGYADVDLTQFLTRIHEAGLTDSVPLLAMLEEMILASSYTMPWPETDLSSLALWYPDIRYNLNAAWKTYMKMEFGKTGWLSLVNLALGKDIIPPESPVLSRQYSHFGKLFLQLKAPVDVDSLYYRLESEALSFDIFPKAYAEDFELSFDIAANGSYTIYAIDRAQNISQALTGDYSHDPLKYSLLIYPNPISDLRLAFLKWYGEESKDESVSLKLYNIKGQKLIHYHFEVPSQNPGMLKLDQVPGLSELAQGIYLLELNSGGKKMHKKLTILY